MPLQMSHPGNSALQQEKVRQVQPDSRLLTKQREQGLLGVEASFDLFLSVCSSRVLEQFLYFSVVPLQHFLE